MQMSGMNIVFVILLRLKNKTYLTSGGNLQPKISM